MTSPTAPTTEIVTIPLRPDIDIEDLSTKEGKAWNEALDIIHAQEGYLQSYYGRQFESPDTLMWVIDWASPASHTAFMDSPSYKPFLEKIDTILSSPAQLHHFLPTSFPPSLIAKVPCTELATFYGCEPGFEGNVERFVGALDGGRPEGYLGSVWGGVVEEIAKGGEKGEEKGKAVVLCIGWESKEHHLRFREESSIFKENIWLLREGNQGAAVVHVRFKRV